MLGMGASQGGFGGRLRLGLLAAVAALFVLVPVSQASAATEYTLTVNIVGEGFVWCEAEYESEEEGEEEEFADECEHKRKFPAGTEVFLEASEFGEEFREFKGCNEYKPEFCKVTMDQDHTVTVVFGPVETKLKIKYQGTGTGTVKCQVEGEVESCKSAYPEEELIVLSVIAIANPGSEFAGFGGDCEGAPDECELQMFGEQREAVVTFNSTGGGSGGGGSGGGSSNPQPVISLPSPIATGPGKLKIAGAGLYKGGKATLRISCKGGERCKGTVKLIAKLEVGHKTQKVTVGKAPFSLAAGAMKALTIKLSGPAKKLLGEGRTLTTTVGGSGVTASKVKIKPTER